MSSYKEINFLKFYSWVAEPKDCVYRFTFIHVMQKLIVHTTRTSESHWHLQPPRTSKVWGSPAYIIHFFIALHWPLDITFSFFKKIFTYFYTCTVGVLVKLLHWHIIVIFYVNFCMCISRVTWVLEDQEEVVVAYYWTPLYRGYASLQVMPSTFFLLYECPSLDSK